MTPRPTPPRPVRRFLGVILLSVLVSFAILTLVDILLSGRLRKCVGLVEPWEEILDGGLDADIVIMGASDASCGFNPETLDSLLLTKSFNLGCEGRHIASQVAKYNLYEKKNKAPAIVIQSLTSLTLLRSQGYEREQFFPFFHDRDFHRTVFPLDSFSPAERFVPMLRYRGGAPHRLRKASHRFRKGFCTIDKPFSRQELANTQARFAYPFYVSEESEKVFQDFLDASLKAGSKIVFVYPPLYRELRDTIKDWEKIYSRFESYASPRGIPVLDYTWHPICEDSTFYYDGIHLNKAGSERFTEIFANDLKRLIDDYGICDHTCP